MWLVQFMFMTGQGGHSTRPAASDLCRQAAGRWSHPQWLTFRRSRPFISSFVCEVACRSLWRRWRARPSLLKLNRVTLLRMWRPRSRYIAFYRTRIVTDGLLWTFSVKFVKKNAWDVQKFEQFLRKLDRNNDFLPRDALRSAVYAVVVCLCVCHTPVLYQNG